MIRRLTCILAGLLALCGSGCQYFGASILSFSSAAHPDSYVGPVYAVAGDTPADGWASLQANYDPADGTVVLTDFEQNAIVEDGDWDLADWAYYREMVKYAPTGGQCMVVLLGWRSGPVEPELVEARQGVTDIAATRVSPMVIVDWRPEVEAHPEWFAPGDPIHPATAEGLQAYADLIQAGVDQCPS